jgi:excisionase family DNA binding protein
MTGEALWTVKETAEYLRMSSSWLYKKVEEGDFPCVRLGPNTVRFVPAQVREYMTRAGTHQPAGVAKVIPLRRPAARHSKGRR